MTRYILILFLLGLFGCSFDTRSGIWTDEKKLEISKKNVLKIFESEKILRKEINSNLILKITEQSLSAQKPSNLRNDLGITLIKKEIDKSSKFKFSKISNFKYFEPELVFDGNNFVFFDDKGNILKFDKSFNLIWKKNFYTKQERKLKPILNFYTIEKYLIVIDSIGKFYAVDLISGDLIWSQYNKNPFNSQIKVSNNKIYAIDFNNILRCFSLKDGSELWKFNSENSFLKSNKRNSLILNNNIIYFNNSLGDILAIDAIKGSLIWQTPTQSSAIYENSFSLINSDLVARANELIFSNNRNEFYSINLTNGIINWKQKINSTVRPIFFYDFIFTISEEGFFFVIDRNSGNIIRSTDIFKNFNQKKREAIKPVGFVLDNEKMVISSDSGHLLNIDISTGKINSIIKIENGSISRPFVFDQKLILVKNDAIIKLN